MFMTYMNILICDKDSEVRFVICEIILNLI